MFEQLIEEKTTARSLKNGIYRDCRFILIFVFKEIVYANVCEEHPFQLHLIISLDCESGVITIFGSKVQCILIIAFFFCTLGFARQYKSS